MQGMGIAEKNNVLQTPKQNDPLLTNSIEKDKRIAFLEDLTSSQNYLIKLLEEKINNLEEKITANLHFPKRKVNNGVVQLYPKH